MYVLLKDFQYTDSTHAIMVLPAGTRFEKEANGLLYFKINRREYALDKQIAATNPGFFKLVEFKTRLTELLKAEKSRTAPKLAELVDELVRVEILQDNILLPQSLAADIACACYHHYKVTQAPQYLEPLRILGFTWDENGYYSA